MGIPLFLTHILGSLSHWWHSLSNNMRIALLAFIGTIIVALIPIVNGYVSKRPNLHISDIRSATLNSKPVIEVILLNDSDSKEAISSLHLTLSNQAYENNHNPVMTITGSILRSEYEASDTHVDSSGKISGCVRQELKSASRRVQCYPLKGKLTIIDLSHLDVQFDWHSQESVEPRDNLLIAFVLPDTMTIPKEKAPDDIFKHPFLRQYISEEHKKVDANKFALSKFLNDLGQLYVGTSIFYRQDQSVMKSARIEFRK